MVTFTTIQYGFKLVEIDLFKLGLIAFAILHQRLPRVIVRFFSALNLYKQYSLRLQP